jgi:hypothetical protein
LAAYLYRGPLWLAVYPIGQTHGSSMLVGVIICSFFRKNYLSVN